MKSESLIRPALLISIFIVIAVVVFLFPLPDRPSSLSMLKVAAKAKPDGIVTIGNSVLVSRSKCDGDRRYLGAMIEDATGKPVIDMSRGGLSLDVALNFALWAAKTEPKRNIVLFLSAFQLQDKFAPDLQGQIFFDIVNHELNINDLSARFADGILVAGRIPPTQKPFSYKSVDYPSYGELTANYYNVEKAKMPCPEILGQNLGFIEANYWKAYILSQPRQENLAALASVQAEIRRRGGRLTILLMPIDYDDIRALSPELADQIGERVSSEAAMLSAAGVQFTDFSRSLGSSMFFDRWCACGHLSEAGRQSLAASTAALLK